MQSEWKVSEAKKDMSEPCRVCKQDIRTGEEVAVLYEREHDDDHYYWLPYDMLHAQCRRNEMIAATL